MLQQIAYRGPDGQASAVGTQHALAMARLAISAPNSPTTLYTDCHARWVTAFNGEIYNYQELTEELRQRGHRFDTTCDAELLPHLFEEYGISGIAKLTGMFSIAAWNEHSRELFLVRDRFGIKPLFYTFRSGILYFASEAKAFLPAVGALAIDPFSLHDVFSFSFPLRQRTFFRDVNEVLPSHYLRYSCDDNVLEERPYYEIPWQSDRFTISRRNATDHLDALLCEVVRDHVRSDVPVAALLSAGLDSSLLVAIAHSLGYALPTYTAQFDSHEWDESEHAAGLSRHLGLGHRTVPVGRDLVDQYEQMLWHCESPHMFPVALPLMGLAQQLQSDRYKVALTGEGADEIFAGYDCFRQEKLRRLLRRLPFQRLKGAAYERFLYRWMRMPREVIELALANESRTADIVRDFGFRPPWYDLWQLCYSGVDDLFSPEVQDATGGRPFVTTLPVEGTSLREALLRSQQDWLSGALFFEMRTRLPSYILLMCDRALMGYGVEGRPPFLDHRIVDFAVRLPPEMKLRGLREKSLLRDVARRYVPKDTAERKKRPFFMPMDSYFFTPTVPEWIQDLLSERELRATQLFRPEAVQKLVLQATSSSSPFLTLQSRMLLLQVINSQVLAKQFGQVPRLGGALHSEMSG